MPYFVYILYSEKFDKFYVGQSRDLKERIKRHNEGRSKYTKPYRPWKLVYKEAFATRLLAVKREREFKLLKSKNQILHLTNIS